MANLALSIYSYTLRYKTYMHCVYSRYDEQNNQIILTIIKIQLSK